MYSSSPQTWRSSRFPGENPSRALGKGVEEVKFSRGEVYLLAALADFDQFGVNLQFPGVEAAGIFRVRADEVLFAEDLGEPGDEFAGIYRGSHIVLSAELYTDDPVHRVFIPEEHYGRDPRPGDGGDHLEPSFVREAVIHHGDIKALLIGDLTRLRPRPGRPHPPALGGQGPPEVQPLLIIPDNQ